MKSTEEAYFDHIMAREPDLEGWRLRVQKPEPPQPGSELADDDAIFPYSPISEAVRISLTSAGEHLRLAMTTLKARQLYPVAHFTTLRTALLAASQGVYILGPDDPRERRSRGLAVVVEAYKRLRQYHQDMLSAPDVTESEKQQLSDQIAWVGQRLEAARKAGADDKVIATKVISSAAKIVYGTEPDKEHAVNLFWRHLSGDAHALLWSVGLRSTVAAAEKGQLLGLAMAGGSFQAIAQPFEASFRILKRGWSLYDQRCEAP